jgi:hypothetical protein
MRCADQAKVSRRYGAGPTEQGTTRTETLQPMVRRTWMARKQANLATFTHLMDDANAVPETERNRYPW